MRAVDSVGTINNQSLRCSKCARNHGVQSVARRTSCRANLSESGRVPQEHGSSFGAAGVYVSDGSAATCFSESASIHVAIVACTPMSSARCERTHLFGQEAPAIKRRGRALTCCGAAKRTYAKAGSGTALRIRECVIKWLTGKHTTLCPGHCCFQGLPVDQTTEEQRCRALARKVQGWCVCSTSAIVR